MLSVVFVTVLCFGFTITNFSIGVDDPSRNYYLYSNNLGSMIQQGRLMHIVLNSLTHSVQFVPFFTDFTGAALYALSTLLYCALFQYVAGGKISSAALTGFCCVYISSSVLVEKYIYHLDVIAVMLSYCLSAVALLYGFRFVKEKKPRLFILACVCLMGALGSYESFLFLYFCGVFGIFILEIVVNKENKSFMELLREGLQYAAILLVSVVIYYSLVYFLQVFTGQHGVFVRDNFWTYSDVGAVATFLEITRSFINFFMDSIRARYLPILVFLLFSGIGFALCGILAFRLKNFWLLPCYFALWFGNFFIHYFSGSFMLRTAQTFCFFVGFVLLLLIDFSAVWDLLRKTVLAATVLLVFVQSADMNRWFYNDYIRYQKEVFAINTIATELVAECDLSKSVIFTGRPDFAYLNTAQYSGRQVNGNSVVYWSIEAFSDPTQPFVAELFRMHGYDFIRSPDEDQYRQAWELAESMPAWPQAGYMQEFEDFTVVNFG